jgi:hypothetical protein
MSQRAAELRSFYQQQRVEDQLIFYQGRRQLFDNAMSQAAGISAILLGFTAAVSALAGTNIGTAAVWAALAAILPAASTALTAFTSLYAFEQQSKIYGDAIRAVRAAAVPLTVAGSASADDDDDDDDDDVAVADLVARVEAALRQEQAQWGQLTSHIDKPDETR